MACSVRCFKESDGLQEETAGFDNSGMICTYSFNRTLFCSSSLDEYDPCDSRPSRAALLKNWALSRGGDGSNYFYTQQGEDKR